MILASADEIVTSVVVAGELRTWIAKNNSPRLSRLVETTLIAVPVQPLGPGIAEIYGRVRAELERAGTPIGGNDLWIAAHALALGAVLVTDNEREFKRVPGLSLDNWLRRSPQK